MNKGSVPGDEGVRRVELAEQEVQSDEREESP